jgi:oligosaccharide repeat unit polymerase
MKYKIKKNNLALILAVAFVYLIIAAINNTSLIFALTMLIFVVAVAYTTGNLSKHIVFLAFLISFFTFLLGNQFVETYFGYKYWISFSEASESHANFCLLLSLIFLFIGYLCGMKGNRGSIAIPGDNNSTHLNELKIKRTQKAALFVYWPTYILLIATCIDIILFVSRHSYIEYYISYSPHIPVILQKLGEMAPFCLFVYLATMPTKKQCRLPLVSYFLYGIISLGTGKRFISIVVLLTILIYLVIRNRVMSNGEVWFKKRYWAYIAISLPFIISGLFVFEYVRTARVSEFHFIGFGNTLLNFFQSVGASTKVIKWGYMYADQIPSGKFYMLGSTLNYLKYNFLNAKLLGYSIGHTAEFAMGGHSFSDVLSYIVYPTRYLAGQGVGSSYIAEAYHDLGYFGVILINFVYGFILRNWLTFDRPHIWKTAISLYIISAFLKAPRGSADAFIPLVLNIKLLFIIILIIVIRKGMVSRIPAQHLKDHF